MSNFKVNQTHFKLFKKYCEYYLDMFNLRSWRVEYSFDEEPDGYRASYSAHVTGMCAELALAAKFDIPPTDKDMKECALHEVLHLLLLHLPTLARDKNVSESLMEIEEHRIIRVFENLLARGVIK